MRFTNGRFELSASDLSRSLSCRHLTALDMAAAKGELKRPPKFEDPLIEILTKRGEEHEKAHVAKLAKENRSVVDLNHIDFWNRDESVAATLDAMHAGADVIVQAGLTLDEWYGRADILERVAKPSKLGLWSYEVADTKLTRETRGATILQLALYSEMLAAAQGVEPDHFHVITPHPDTPVHTFRVNDYAAYFRLIKARLQETTRKATHTPYPTPDTPYPEPVEYCSYCQWYTRCRDQRRADDHLSLVANITRAQRRELVAQDVTTLTQLAQLPVPLQFKPERGSKEALERAREQASLQLQARSTAVPPLALQPVSPTFGLTRLPEPSKGDVFLDLEGDPFAAEGGREYLFGLILYNEGGDPEYRSFWGATEHDERKAFESVMDLIGAQLAAHPGMHVYHYAPYEQTAFKRLMGRYATREKELDALLRGAQFVDLYAVVKQAMFVGVEKYSIKNLEPLYAFTRDVNLQSANRALRAMETALEMGVFSAVPDDVLKTVEGYNRDDCISTLHLRDWLEGVRAKAEADGVAIPRPVVAEAEAPKGIDDRAQVVDALRARLIADIPEVASERSKEQQARWVLGFLLDWHRREDKSTWWEYFKLRDMPEDELIDERQAIAGLEFVERIGFTIGKNGKPNKTEIQRFRYPLQEMEIKKGDELKTKDGKEWGPVSASDRIARTIDVEIGPSKLGLNPRAVFSHKYISPRKIEETLLVLATQVADAGTLDAQSGTHRAFCDLLLASAPRLTSGSFAGASPNVDLAVNTVLKLDHSTLAIQGPPGAGKTYTGAHMILALVKAGKRVGITASSHKVIRVLIDAVHKESIASGTPVRMAHRCRENERDENAPHIKFVTDNEAAIELIADGAVDVLGGTSFMWACEELEHSVDVLFVDEAGQMSLANAIAVSRAAKSLVLLGDPQQLEQPRKGSHPDGVGVSALQHILGAHQTMPETQGIFLPVTYRMHPSITQLTSELYYDSKLTSKPGLEGNALRGTGDFDGAGLWMVPVTHEGNTNYSDEEVDVVERLVKQLTAKGAEWVNEKGVAAQMTASDVLVVAPYNAHVNRLQERLAGAGVRVGTVDKFQGQEGPVVIYTMATSRPEDAPRGMSFLYSPNRFNVATSRAQCAAILVASPALFEPSCETPAQMKLANGVCRYREMASEL